MRRGPARPWRRLGSAAVGLVVVASLLSACSAVRSGQGTTDEACYLALPTAARAVGGHGHLAGVRKFTLGSLHGMAPRLSTRFAHDVPKGQSVCLAAYTGHFRASMVRDPVGRSTGTLAVAVVTTPGGKLLGTLILNRIPVGFKHLL